MNQLFASGIFIVGVRKCGTTTVFDFLKNTGAFRAARLKEPQFFCLPDDTVAQHRQWYETLFAPNDRRPVLDGSTLYYPTPFVRQRIGRLVCEPRYIVCLRNPARRMFSAYWHQRGKPGRPERRSFDTILDQLENTPAVDLYAREQALLEEALEKGGIAGLDPASDYHRQQFGAKFGSDGLDHFAFFRYAGESLYSRHAPEWLNRPDTLVVFVEELLKYPAETLKKLGEFAGLPPDIPLRLPANRNKAYDGSRVGWLNRLAQTETFARLKRAMPDQARHFMKEYLLPEAEKMTAVQYRRAHRLLQVEFEFWQNRYPALSVLWQS